MIEVDGAECARAASEFAEAARVGTVVHLSGVKTLIPKSIRIHTTSSDDSLAGLLGSVVITLLSAWSKA